MDHFFCSQYHQKQKIGFLLNKIKNNKRQKHKSHANSSRCVLCGNNGVGKQATLNDTLSKYAVLQTVRLNFSNCSTSTLHYKSLNNSASTRRHQQESSLYQRQQILSSLSFATTSISQHLINMVHNVLLSSSASSWISAVSGIHTRVNGSRLSAFHSLAFALLQHATEESSLTQDDEKLAILHTNLLRRLLSKQFTMMISHLKKKQQTQLLIFTSNLESTSEAAKMSTIQQTCAI